MARVLLSLRLAILRRTLTRTGGAWLWPVVWWGAGLLGLGAGALMVLGAAFTDGHTLELAAAAGLWFSWLIVPMTSPALQDQAVDPERLQPYPLTARQKVRGLLLGALVAPMALASLAFLVPLAAMPELTWFARPVMVVAAAAVTVMCVLTSRVLQAALARVAATRRGRDVTLLVTGALSAGTYGAYMVLLQSDAVSAVGVAQPVAGALAWTPPGAAVQAAIDLSDGAPGGALARVAVVAAWCALMLVAWVGILARRERRGGGGGRARAASSRRGGLALLPWPWRALRPGPVVAAAAQQQRMLVFRDPRAAQQLVMAVVVAGFVAHGSGMPFGLGTATAVFGGFMAIMLGVALLNYDGRGFEHLVIAGAPLQAVLRGKAAAVAALTALAMTAFALGEAVWSGAGSDLPGAVLSGVAGVVLGVSLGAFVSVRAPYDASRKSSGRFDVVGWLLLAFVVLGVTVAAASALMSLAGLPPVVGGVVALALAVLARAALMRAAGRRLVANDLKLAHLLLD